MLQNKYVFLGLIFFMHSFTYAQSLSDPTQPPGSNVEMNSITDEMDTDIALYSLEVKSIFFGGTTKNSYAVINNQVYRYGDQLDNTKVIKIGSNYVSLADGRKLVLFASVIKK